MQPEKRIKFIPNRLDVPSGLLDKVMLRLETEQKLKVLRRRLFWAATLLVGSVVAFVFVLRLFWLDVASSGFGQYTSLIFSDFGYILANWRDYTLSLLETLPAFSAGVSLAAALAVLYGVKLTLGFGREFKSNLRRLSVLNH